MPCQHTVLSLYFCGIPRHNYHYNKTDSKTSITNFKNLENGMSDNYSKYVLLIIFSNNFRFGNRCHYITPAICCIEGPDNCLINLKLVANTSDRKYKLCCY
jgi:hypothetical protein